ncbi:MAG: hypothetical protein ACYSWO_28260 [Planctomycetota bacterium]|jgi:hypothetical protein
MKKWYASKTFWVNALTFGVGLVGYAVGHEVIAENPELISVLIAVQGALNVVLRFVTSQPVEV